MDKYILYLGLNDKDSKKQEIATSKAFKEVVKLISASFDGGTMSLAKGVYTHDSGTIVVETTIKIELLFTDEKSVKELVEKLKSIFNQESVAVQREVVDSALW